jgi:hypothetical protein
MKSGPTLKAETSNPIEISPASMHKDVIVFPEFEETPPMTTLFISGIK